MRRNGLLATVLFVAVSLPGAAAAKGDDILNFGPYVRVGERVQDEVVMYPAPAVTVERLKAEPFHVFLVKHRTRLNNNERVFAGNIRFRMHRMPRPHADRDFARYLSIAASSDVPTVAPGHYDVLVANSGGRRLPYVSAWAMIVVRNELEARLHRHIHRVRARADKTRFRLAEATRRIRPLRRVLDEIQPHSERDSADGSVGGATAATGIVAAAVLATSLVLRVRRRR